MLNDLNLKGILAIALLLGATLLAALGRMPIGEWESFAELIFGTYAAAKAATTIASTIASRPATLPAPASNAPATASVVVNPAPAVAA